MTEPLSASTSGTAVAISIDDRSTSISTVISPPQAEKRTATEAFDGSFNGDIRDSVTTLDDVVVSPLGKRTKLLDDELPDVDDNEEFAQQEEDLDADLALGLKTHEMGQEVDEDGLILATGGPRIEHDDLSVGHNPDASDLALSEEEVDDSEALTSQNNEIDIVDVDEEDDEGSAPPVNEQFSDQEEEDDEETARAIVRAQNQREARKLLQQLDDSARSKMCLMALEKYGEELFYGHEEARDAILVDACAQDSVLSLMRDAIKVRDLYLRGSSAAAPVELDDDGETGGYEDEEEEEDDGDEYEEEEEEEEEFENNDDIVVISEEEDGDEKGDSQVQNRRESAYLNSENEEEIEAQIGAEGAREEEDIVNIETEAGQDVALLSVGAPSDGTAT